MLTKSLLLEHLRCPKALWLATHDKGLATPGNAFTERLKAQGSAVGELARELYPGGILIEVETGDSDEAVRRTAEAMAGDAPAVFEATFRAGGMLVKVDLLVREGTGWWIVEVKAATKFKKTEHVPDVAAQWWTLAQAGVALKGASLMYVDPGARGATAEELFVEEDITYKVEAAQERMQAAVEQGLEVQGFPATPDVRMGDQCDKPRTCSFYDHCRAADPLPSPSVFELPRIGAKKWALAAEGKIALEQVANEDLNERQRHVRDVILSGERWVDGAALARDTACWGFPMLHLDFETCSWAIPPFEGVLPFEQVPVQYSLHVEERSGAEPLHFEFLHDGAGDPRAQVAAALTGHLEPYFASSGERLPTVTAYSMSVEAGCLRRLAQAVPASGELLLAAAGCLVDPLPLLRDHVYDLAFKGSYSIKSVAPALLGEAFDYGLLAIHHGAEAMAQYDLLRGSGEPEERRAELRRDLLEYCRQDTSAMLELVRWIRRAAERP